MPEPPSSECRPPRPTGGGLARWSRDLNVGKWAKRAPRRRGVPAEGRVPSPRAAWWGGVRGPGTGRAGDDGPAETAGWVLGVAGPGGGALGPPPPPPPLFPPPFVTSR